MSVIVNFELVKESPAVIEVKGAEGVGFGVPEDLEGDQGFRAFVL